VEMSSNLHQYDGFDVWENELDYENIQHFLKNSDYDLALIDIDNPNALKKWGQADDYFFLTSYEHPVIMQNTKLLESLFENQRDIELNPLTPVIHDVGVNQDENYLKGFVDHLPISWNESIIYYL